MHYKRQGISLDKLIPWRKSSLLSKLDYNPRRCMVDSTTGAGSGM